MASKPRYIVNYDKISFPSLIYILTSFFLSGTKIATFAVPAVFDNLH